MLLGYNTNGLAHHDPYEALELLAEIGYRSVALTLDHGPLNPFAADWPANLARLKETLRRLRIPRTDPWGKPLPGEALDGVRPRDRGKS